MFYCIGVAARAFVVLHLKWMAAMLMEAGFHDCGAGFWYWTMLQNNTGISL